MNQLFSQIKRLQFLYKLIETEQTGKPEELAKELHISRRQLYNLLDEFNLLGGSVKYNRIRQTFYFTRPLVFKVEIQIRPLTEEEMKENSGGSVIFSFRARLLHGMNIFLYL